MVDEALVAGTIANTNGLLVILAKLVAKGVFDGDDLKAFSDSYSKPLDHVGMRENELVSQMQDQMEETLAELMHFLARSRSAQLHFALDPRAIRKGHVPDHRNRPVRADDRRMEGVAYATHRWVMHGRLGWWLHASHHRRGTGRFELNDLYGGDLRAAVDRA